MSTRFVDSTDWEVEDENLEESEEDWFDKPHESFAWKVDDPSEHWRNVAVKSYRAEIHSWNELRDLFLELAEEWRNATLVQSSLERMVLHPAYQRIIGMGSQAIPFILEDLERQTDHWFWALNAITGEDLGRGSITIQEAAQSWLEWGREQGFLSH